MSKKKTVTRTVTVSPKSTNRPKSAAAKKTSTSPRPTGKKASGGKAAPADKSSQSSKSAATARSTTSTKKKNAKPAGAEKELLALLPELNTEELTWLVTQARTIIYNHKVDEVNKAARNLVEAKNRNVAGTKKGNKSGTNQKAAVGETVDIIQVGEGRSFILLMGKTRLFMTINELKGLVKIAQAADNSGDGAGRLFRWMKKERGDMLIDAALSGPGDSRLLKVYNLLQDKFTVG